MFNIDERYLAQFMVAANGIAQTINDVSAYNHEIACKNAAENAIQTGKPPAMVIAESKVRPKAGTFPTVEMETTGEPCSTKTPQDFMPQPTTGEIGNGIGKLIPGTTRMYHDNTPIDPPHGEIRTVNGKSYRFQRPYPFASWWELV